MIASRAWRHVREPRLRRRWLAALITLGVSTLPLVGTPGYENGFVLSPLAAIAGLAVGLTTVRARRESQGATVRQLVLDVVREGFVLTAIVLALLTVALLWQTNCDPLAGLAWFVMGPTLSFVVGGTCGLASGVAATGRRRQLLLAAAIPVASTVIGLWRLYADPVVYAYDPFFGYFSGSVYDERVNIGDTYLLFRFYNLTAVLAAIGWMSLLVDPETLTVRRRIAQLRARAEIFGGTVLATVVALSLGLTAPKRRFTANVETITKVLSASRTTEHFVIHYNPRTADARTIDAIAAEHELAWARLREQMDGREPDGRVTSFVFSNPDQKRALMGAGTVQVAAPWRGQIYLDHRPFPHPVLQHELAHIFGRTVGDDIFGIARSGLHLNIALVEGFATALAPRPSDHLDLHDRALILERLGRRPSIVSIMGPAFLTKSSRVAYTTAGSFCQWLIQTRGFSGMATLYRSAGDFQTAYGESLDDLEAQWLAFLEARGGVTDDDVESKRQLFQRRSVFRRPCAHRAADLRAKIRRADRSGRVTEMVDNYETLCRIEPDDPAHPLGLARALALQGDFAAAFDALDAAEALDDLTVTILARVHERRADVALAAGNLDEAIEALDAALALPGARSSKRALQLRHFGAEHSDLAPLVVDYLNPFNITLGQSSGAVMRLAAAIRIRDQPRYRALGSYLVARQLLAVQDAQGAAPHLERALRPGPGDAGLPSQEFDRAARLALLSSLVRTGGYARAREVLADLAAMPGGHGDELAAEDWRTRIDFFEAYLGAPDTDAQRG